MQGLNHVPCLIGRTIVNKNNKTILSDCMRVLETVHLLFQYVGCYMQRCFLVITRNHECYHLLTLCLSIQSALLHIIRHAYSVCHAVNPVKVVLSDSTRHYLRPA